MNRFRWIIIFITAASALTGCEPPKPPLARENIKIGDLAPIRPEAPANLLFRTINFDVYIFEVPAKQADSLDDLWRSLYSSPLRFKNARAFEANGFSVGYGQLDTWDQIGDILRSIGAITTEKTSILLADGDSEDVPITELEKELTVFYLDGPSQPAGVTIGPGSLSLRVKAQKIPGSKGLCKVTAQPAFIPARIDPITAKRIAAGEDFLFRCAEFELNMTGGDFFLLGPEKYTTDRVTLNSLFFWEGDLVPRVKTYFVVCTAIID